MYKILVIEDNKSILLFIDKLLTHKGFQVLKASHGKLGLELAIQSHPDLIICDVLMPDFDGYEVLKEIRKNSLTQTIPFIFLSGQNSKEDLRQGMNLGADDYLTKPFTQEDLFTAIDTRLTKKNILERHTQETLNILRQNLTTAFPHEFRTPLQNIILATDYLESIVATQSVEISDLEEVIEVFRASTQRLLNLSQKFLFYSNLETKILDQNYDDFLINARLKSLPKIVESIATKQAQTYQRTHDLNLNIAESLIAIKEDSFTYLLQEIIDNSLKFSNGGTMVNITGVVKPPYYELTVTNQGRGFLPEQLKNIGAYIQFERPKYEQQGSGLGLAIAQKIVAIYQGNLTINSIPHQETTIMIQIPLASDEQLAFSE